MLIFRVAIFSILVLQMSNSFAAILNIQPESVNAQAWVILDPQTKQIIAEHNPQQQRAPASLTKMMVAYIILKDIQSGRLKKDQIITVDPIVQQVKNDESKMNLAVGEQITIDQLLSGLIIMSANDAALTLAKVSGNGDTQSFIQRMNDEAKLLGMNQTSFANPSGISMPQHYSTAYDLSLLSLALIEQTPDYLNYSKQTHFTYKKTHLATNILLTQDSRVDGLKTGFTHAAGFNLALTASQTIAPQALPSTINNQINNQRRLIVIVLGTPNKQQRAEVSYKLLNLAFEYTQNIHLIKKQTPLTQIPILNGDKKQFTLYAPQDFQFTASRYLHNTAINLQQFNLKTMRLESNENTIEPIQAELSYHTTPLQQALYAPLNQKNYAIAHLDIIQNQQTIHQITLHQDITLSAMAWWQKIILWIKNLFQS